MGRQSEHEHDGLSEADLAEIGRQVGDLITNKLEPVNQKIIDVQKELNGLEERGDYAAQDQKIQDLEAKLVEREEKLGDLMKQHQNEIRLVKTDLKLAQLGDPRDPLQMDYQGAFVKDVAKLKELVYSYAGSRSPQFDQIERLVDTSDIGSAGALPTEVADRFIDNVISEQPMLGRVTTRRMLSSSARLDEIRISNRQMTSPNENTAPTIPADQTTFHARTLNTIEVVWGEDITLNFLEDNIERANAEAHIASLLARQFGTDLDDLGHNGRGASGTGFTALDEGFIEIINAFTAGTGVYDMREVTVPGTGLTVASTFREMHKAIEQRFKARTDWGFFVPTGTAERYADEVQQRETSLGDSVLIDGFPALRYFGRPVWPDSHLNDATNLTGNARPYLASTTNLVFGIHRNIRVDSEFQPRRRAVEYTISARIGYEIAVPYLVVKLSNVLPTDQR